MKDTTIKADSLAEAYAMAFDEVGPEFDVLEIKKVSSGAFGGTHIQIKVAPVQKLKPAAPVKKEAPKVETPKLEVSNTEVPKVKVEVPKAEVAAPKVEEKKEDIKLEILHNPKLREQNLNDQEPIKIRDFDSDFSEVSLVGPGAMKNSEDSEKLSLMAHQGSAPAPKTTVDIRWEEIVFRLRSEGFQEDLIVKLLTEIKSSGKHLNLSPFSLVEDRLVYYCVSETRSEQAINILLAENKTASSLGISAFLFSHYAKQGLTSNKVVLTNSVRDLKKILGKDFLSILQVELLEVSRPQDWLKASPKILSQPGICCVYFNNGELELPDIPDAMGSLCFTKLISWSETLDQGQTEFLRDCKAQLLVAGLEENTKGSLLRPSLQTEIPTGFILRGKEYLSGLVHSSDLIRELIEAISGSASVERRKAS